MQRKMAKI